MSKHEVAVRPPWVMSPEEQFEFDWRMGKALAASGMFKDARQAEQAFAKIIVGRELGMTPAQAMTGLHLVEGNVQAHYATLGLFVRKNGRDYRIVEHTNDKCSIEFGPAPAPGRAEDGSWLPWPEAVGVSSFSMEDAVTAGLIRGAKMYEKFPRNMLFARAMSNGVKWYCPEVLGGVPVYVEGEIESGRAVDGVVDGTVVEEDHVSLSLSEVADAVPEELRLRFYAAYGEAADLSRAPSLLAARMSVKDQPFERVAEYIAEIELANETARAQAQDVADADVVEPGLPDDGVDLGDLNRQLSDLYALREGVQEQPGDLGATEAELDRIGQEIDRLEGLRDAAQERLL